MPTDVAAGSVIKVTINSLLDQQLVQNVFHIMNNAATTLEAIEDMVNNNLLDELYQALSHELACTSVAVQSLWPVLTDPYEEAKSFTGGDVLESLPVANAVIVSLKTGLGGRTKRGRKYLCGVVAQGVDDSRLTETYRNTLQTDWNTIMGYWKQGGTGSAVMGILSRQPPPDGDLSARFTPVTSAIVRPVLGTMRSRLPGHGR